ncbi:MAG: hypothetical protein HYT11_02795, partial [Candidatus Levybacteria bacterium]|nr:hypothetical protein [Candidatus Levybacteria bacterium]
RSNQEKDNSGSHGRGCGCGCSAPAVVLFIGLGLAVLKGNVGIGVSARIPFTESNITLAGSVGHKDLSKDTLPYYVADRMGGNNNFINDSLSLTIGPAQGSEVFVIGKQPDAPLFDIHLDLDSK